MGMWWSLVFQCEDLRIALPSKNIHLPKCRWREVLLATVSLLSALKIFIILCSLVCVKVSKHFLFFLVWYTFGLSILLLFLPVYAIKVSVVPLFLPSTLAVASFTNICLHFSHLYKNSLFKSKDAGTEIVLFVIYLSNYNIGSYSLFIMPCATIGV